MTKNFYLLVLSIALIFTSCSNDDDAITPIKNTEFYYDFAEDTEGWQGDFADYPEGEEDFFELEVARRTLPAPLDENENAMMLCGNNHSDDLFMFLKRKISGLEANQTYEVIFDITFATNVADNMFGVGGSPGSSVFVKAGASTVEPKKMLDAMDYYRMNIDKGNQATKGDDMINLGDFTNETEESSYTLKTLSNDKESVFEVTTDENGEVWVIVGTDSGFEATTTIYYNTISIKFY